MRVIALKRENVRFRFERRAPVDMTMVLSMGRRQCRKMTGERAEVRRGLNGQRRKWIRSGSTIHDPMLHDHEDGDRFGRQQEESYEAFVRSLVRWLSAVDPGRGGVDIIPSGPGFPGVVCYALNNSPLVGPLDTS
jgi:hypothetical protein